MHGMQPSPTSGSPPQPHAVLYPPGIEPRQQQQQQQQQQQNQQQQYQRYQKQHGQVHERGLPSAPPAPPPPLTPRQINRLRKNRRLLKGFPKPGPRLPSLPDHLTSSMAQHQQQQQQQQQQAAQPQKRPLFVERHSPGSGESATRLLHSTQQPPQQLSSNSGLGGVGKRVAGGTIGGGSKAGEAWQLRGQGLEQSSAAGAVGDFSYDSIDWAELQ